MALGGVQACGATLGFRVSGFEGFRIFKFPVQRGLIKRERQKGQAEGFLFDLFMRSKGFWAQEVNKYKFLAKAETPLNPNTDSPSTLNISRQTVFGPRKIRKELSVNAVKTR